VVWDALREQWQMVFVFLLLLVVLVMFFTEVLPAEITALVSLALLGFTGILTIEETFSGFSNQATLAVLMMFVLSAGVLQSGIIDWIGERVGRLMGQGLTRQVFVLALLVGPISAFINNTPAVAVFIPLVILLASRTGHSPSRLLIPLSFAAMLGGTLTLIGTSTNLLASSIRRDYGLGTFGMFEFTKAGAIVFGVGVLYLFLLGHRLIPERILAKKIDERYKLREFLFEVEVPEGSPLLGKPIGESALDAKFDAEVLQVRRGTVWRDPEDVEMAYEAGNRLLVRAGLADLKRMADTGIVKLLSPEKTDKQEVPSFEHDDIRFAEILVSPGSGLHNRTLGQARLWKQHRVRPVAVLSRGSTATRNLNERRLRSGDVLLVQGHQRDLETLSGGREFHVLGGPETPLRRPHKIPHVLFILAAVVGVAALGLAPIHLTATAGAILMVVTGALRLDDMYSSISWPVIFLLAGIIPLGVALQKTGGAAFLAGLIASAADFAPPIVILGLMYLMATLLTEVLSNNASVVLLVPIAIELALGLGLNPTTFILAVMFAASTSFLTPIGYQTNLMVMTPGGYRFGDYIRVGGPLNLVLVVVTPVVLNHFWPLA
jgi:di/tricarboxylate transporter